MIHACFKVEKDKAYYYRVTGHAGYAEEGKDIVCASVSSLYISITNQLLELGNVFERNGGFFVLDGNSNHDTLVNTLYNGLKNIEKDYQDYIKVEVRS